jgi:predicted nucleic acid binding AN1-type Zn finger protein
MSKVFTTKSKDTKTSKKKSSKKLKRCDLETCKRKLHLTDSTCRCKHTYCTRHRLPEVHSCTYNFKNESDKAFMKRVGLGGGEVCKLEVI